MISERLERLVEEMVDRGVRFEDAVREFEKRFISRVLLSCDGSLTKASEALGIHRIAERTVPLSLAAVESRGPVRATLELAGGTAERLNLRIGDRVLHRIFGTAP